MGRKTVQQLLDLRQPEINLERFSEALVVHHIRLLIDSGGNTLGCPYLNDSLYPKHLKVFVERAVIKVLQTHHFGQEWLRLKVRLSDVNAAWEQGQAAFQHDLTRAAVKQEEMGYFSVIDFASDCYAVAAAQSYYQFDRALQAWLINGYMVAWWQHFSVEEEIAG